MYFKEPKRIVERVFLHCTAYAHQDLTGLKLLNAVDSWHRARDFNEIGYHFLIDCKGELIEGRSLESTPAAQQGHNSRTIAICLDGLYFNQFNRKQFSILRELVTEIDYTYENITYHGHCEVSNKTCPVFDYPAELGLDRSGRRVDSYRTHYEKSTIKETIGHRTLSLTCKGEDVQYLQKYLHIHIDGCFGQETYQAVSEFQKDNDLYIDGIVGPLTWSVLYGFSKKS